MFWLLAIGVFAACRLVAATLPTPSPSPAVAAPVDYLKDVRPILAARCYECHGPEKHKGGFRADSKSIALGTTDSGERPIVPGSVEKSDLLTRVQSRDVDEQMPPKGDRLTSEQINLLTRWVNEGASWPETESTTKATTKWSHWAFNKPLKVAPPVVKDSAWPRNPIDNFILAAQEKQNLKPSPEADKYALIRRATFDLTGLPPTPAEVAQFIADTAPDAFDRLVDRLLASPHYGERWTRVWMDIARYADSAGYGQDPLRYTAWPYRDWVIKAFNSNLPFDQFTIQQLAGDLLPNPTRDQLIATAFHRNTMTNTEGGTIREEWRTAAVKDRTNVTVQAWMGLTMGCTECHTHKYDPITQREYYSFFAFFNQTQDDDQPTEAPTLPLPTPDQERRQREIPLEIAKAQAEIDDPGNLAAKLPKWEKMIRDSSDAWGASARSDGGHKAAPGATLTKQPDGSVLASGKRSATDTYTITASSALKNITAFQIEALPDDSLPAKGPGRGDDGNFVLNDFKVAVAPAGQIPSTVRGRFVRLELSGKERMIHVAEVQVFSGEENIATKGAATQSSTDFGGLPERAIDGKTDGVYENKSVSHTAVQENPWWEVDLKSTHDLNKFVIWPRTDGADLFKRLDGLRVSVLDENRKVVWMTLIDKGPEKSLEIIPGGPSTVQRQLTDRIRQLQPSGICRGQGDR